MAYLRTNTRFVNLATARYIEPVGTKDGLMPDPKTKSSWRIYDADGKISEFQAAEADLETQLAMSDPNPDLRQLSDQLGWIANLIDDLAATRTVGRGTERETEIRYLRTVDLDRP